MFTGMYVESKMEQMLEQILKDNIADKQRLIDELVAENTKLRKACRKVVAWCRDRNDGSYESEFITDLLNVIRKE